MFYLLIIDEQIREYTQSQSEFTKRNYWQSRATGSRSPSVPGHTGVEANERADEEAKKAAAGRSSRKTLLPIQLHKPLPQSCTSIVRMFRKHLDSQHNCARRRSPRYAKFRLVDPSNATIASRAYWKLERELPRKLLRILTQLRTGHIPLQKHLHRIKKVESPYCPCCKRDALETVFHYMMKCPAHRVPRERFRRRVAAKNWNIAALLTGWETLKHLFHFIGDTGIFHIVGVLPPWD